MLELIVLSIFNKGDRYCGLNSSQGIHRSNPSYLFPRATVSALCQHTSPTLHIASDNSVTFRTGSIIGNSWIPALSGTWAYEKQNKGIWSFDITLVKYITAAPGNVTKTTKR